MFMQYVREISKFFVKNNLKEFGDGNYIFKTAFNVPYMQVTFRNKNVEGYVNVYSDKLFQLRWETDDDTFTHLGFNRKIFFTSFMNLMEFLEKGIGEKSSSCLMVPHY